MVAVVLVLITIVVAPTPVTADDGGYVGTAVCGSCHRKEHELWRGSHHDRAMQPADATSVLGLFDGGSFTSKGVRSTFARDDNHFSVETEGADGKHRRYRVAYTFGVEPLQQYLVPFPGGRHQALTIAWDSRPKSAGGQRWFDLYPQEATPPGDVLHWTGTGNNWNRMCADCHSTNVQTRYDVTNRTYTTSMSEIDVACEACHGPGGRHATWAQQRKEGSTAVGLAVHLSDSSAGDWVMNETGIARLRQPRSSRAEIETCAPCHSRRAKIAEHSAGAAFLDGYQPALLDEDLYFADGQMQDEVYVWGSFVQSRMFAAGVTCSDCHEPHGLQLRAEGNALCARCHLPAKFDTPAHHHHERGSRGAACVECHMPARTYMLIDRRHDHSFRVPQPQLSQAVGAPNACNDCHSERTPEWAAAAVANWNSASPRPHFAPAIAAGRRLGEQAGTRLPELIGDPTQPAIARATALRLLPSFAIEDITQSVRTAVTDTDALVRAAAADAAGMLPPEMRPGLIVHLLDDGVRHVRLRAARALASSRPQLALQTAENFDRVLSEHENAQRLNADQPQAHVDLGSLYADLGMAEEAERAYRTALDVGSYFVPAYVNLADLYRARGEDAQAETTLRRGLQAAAGDAALHHSLGLTQVRLGRTKEGVEELGRAYELEPEARRYAYVYAIGLNSIGERARALQILEKAAGAHPADLDIVAALAMLYRDSGNASKAREHATRIAREWPRSRAAQELRASFEAPK